MTSVGSTLRSEREAQGRAMAEIAHELCITQAYLRAIETDDIKSLPGTFFYKSFVRQYIAILGLDPALLRAGIQQLVAAAEPAPVAQPAHWQTGIRVPDPILEAANKLDLSSRRIGLSFLGLVAAVLACSGVYYAWMNNQRQVTVSNAPAESTASVVQAVSMTPVQASIPADDAGPSLDVTTTTGADGIRRVVLNLSAKEETWLSITSAGKNIFSGTLEPTETKTLEGLEVARLKVGNAGGLEIRWNGKPIGPIGESGQVRVVLFTPDNFEILPPAGPAPDFSETL
jgi:cytoskeletal protein RodZ